MRETDVKKRKRETRLEGEGERRRSVTCEGRERKGGK